MLFYTIERCLFMLKKIILLIAFIIAGSFNSLKTGTLFSKPVPSMVDISGIDKALLLVELYSAVGLTTFQIMPDEAQKIIDKKLAKGQSLAFDKIYGKKLNIDISGDLMDASQYDRLAHKSAQKVVVGIRRSSELAARS